METPTVNLSPEGYLEIKLSGNLSGATIEELERQIKPIVDQLQRQQKRIFSLVDLSAAGSYNPASNKAAMNLMENIPYEKVAMFGANFALREVIKLITAAMGKTENTRVFDKREEALAWLLQVEKPSNPVQ